MYIFNYGLTYDFIYSIEKILKRANYIVNVAVSVVSFHNEQTEKTKIQPSF